MSLIEWLTPFSTCVRLLVWQGQELDKLSVIEYRGERLLALQLSTRGTWSLYTISLSSCVYFYRLVLNGLPWFVCFLKTHRLKCQALVVKCMSNSIFCFSVSWREQWDIRTASAGTCGLSVVCTLEYILAIVTDDLVFHIFFTASNSAKTHLTVRQAELRGERRGKSKLYWQRWKMQDNLFTTYPRVIRNIKLPSCLWLHILYVSLLQQLAFWSCK